MSGFTVLVPAAGQGQRFRDAGYSVLKPLIQFSLGDGPERPMVLHALSGAAGATRRVVGLPPARHHDRPPLPGVEVYDVHHTDGQAHTVLQLLVRANIAPDQSVVVLNSDICILQSLTEIVSTFDQTGADAGVLVYPKEDASSYSFVSESGWFRRAAEKQRISPFAIVGVFWFQNPTALRNNLAKVVAASKTEPYLSAVFSMFENNWATTISEKRVLEFGTPEKLAATLEKYR